MKLSFFTSFSNKYAFLCYLLLILISGSICLSSCKDDMDRLSSSPRISFTSEISSSRTSFTRSTSDADTPQSTVTALRGGSTPLYLHTLYTDSIATPSSDGRPDTAVPAHPDTNIPTRATPVTNTNMYDRFGVSAYSYTDFWIEDQKTPDYFYNATAVKSGNGYVLSSTYYWPGASYKMRFFAYAPKDHRQYVLSGSTHAGSPTISVTIPSNVDEQKDLLVAKTGELNSNINTVVRLTFHHALTAVRFECGNDMQGGTVKSVSLKNVCSEGTYYMGRDSWDRVGTPATFSQTLNKVTTGNTGEALTTDAQTFMMIPQTLPSGAQIEVVFTDKSGTDHTLTADIKDKVWPKGKTVTYKISSSSINWTYTLTVPQPADFTYTGGTQQYSVTSYRQNTKGQKEAIAWTAQYSENNGASWTDNRPDWLTAFTTSGTGGSTAQSYHATVSAQTGTDNTHTIALRNAAPKGSASSPYNLANQTNGSATIENTANCYVVNAPGHYSFPLVYGNAIKNGATNSSAYTSTVASTNILSKFINHTGNAITDPYIRRNAGCIPAKAELVWQDAPDLVTDITYHPTGDGYISFTVNKNTIQQGNAVIAIKDASGIVLWSWHIWVTDENIDNTIAVTNYQGKIYHLMSVNLGWCDAYTRTYAERSCKVRFTAGSLIREITIRQAPHSITAIGGNHPYYQWGRKDPFPPSDGSSGDTNKTWYDKDGVSSTGNPATENLSTGITCIKNYILKPAVMQRSFTGDNQYLNLWSADNYSTDAAINNLVIKTIYDPSPVGFKLPGANAFTGFTTTGDKVITPSQINGTWDSSLQGWNFYTDSSKKTTIFFPASGQRTSAGKLNSFSNGYWTAIPSSLGFGRYLSFKSSEVSPLDRLSRTYGLGVRPSQE